MCDYPIENIMAKAKSTSKRKTRAAAGCAAPHDDAAAAPVPGGILLIRVFCFHCSEEAGLLWV